MGGLGEEVGSGADGGVACKGDLLRGGEYVDRDRVGRIGVRGFVEEDCLSEIEFAGDGLFLGLGEGCGGWEVDDGEGVAEEGGVGEDVEGGVAEHNQVRSDNKSI